MFISKLEKDELNKKFHMLINKCIEQEVRINELEAIINTLTDLFSVEINARVGKKCAELTTTLTEKLGDALKELDKTFGKIVNSNKKKTTKAEPKKETKVEPKKTDKTKKAGK